MTYAPFARKGSYQEKSAFDSLKKMKENTNSNFVILAPNGLQDTAQSEEICYTSEATVSDDELKGMIDYAKELGMRVALKPTVNCKNGTWRAHVNFFDEDVVCEPKWCNWFESYTEFQLHYARLAKEMGVEMHIAGCEMVMAERREAEWRKLIADIRSEFDGFVSYNTDKYQEHNVKWFLKFLYHRFNPVELVLPVFQWIISAGRNHIYRISPFHIMQKSLVCVWH